MNDAALKSETQDIVVDEDFPHAPATIWKTLTTSPPPTGGTDAMEKIALANALDALDIFVAQQCLMTGEKT